MIDHAYADWITENDLHSLLLSPPFTIDWMILEAVDEVVNLNRFQNGVDLTRFCVGRVFGTACEIRWQRDGQQFHTLLIGDVVSPPSFLKKHHQELAPVNFDREDREYYLWGEWSEKIPKWIEATIPHIFDFPPPPNNGRWRYKLKTTEYINRESGEMEFYRFTGTFKESL